MHAIHWPKVEHHTVTLKQGPLHYVEAGRGAPLLLIHGGHGGWVHWLANIDALAQHHRVLAIDLPGFGRSFDAGRLLLLEEFADVLVQLLDLLGIDQAAAVGFSFGALVAATLAARHPARVGRLAVVNPPGVGPYAPESLSLAAELAALAREKGLKVGVAATLRTLMVANEDRFNEQILDVICDCVVKTRYVTRHLSRSIDMLEILAEVKLRTMVMFGEEDPYHRHDLSGRRVRVNSALRQVSVTIVPNAAHWIQYDRPSFFNNALTEFLSMVEPDGAPNSRWQDCDVHID